MTKKAESHVSRRVFLGAASILAGAEILRSQEVIAASKASAASHVVLLGDSIFDNSAYVVGGPDVIRQLRDALPLDASATLLAVDGTLIAGVSRQLAGVPLDATHFVVSVGGNDALRYRSILQESARSVGEALVKVAAVRDRFAQDYRAMLDEITRSRLPTAICTIYDGRFPDEDERQMSSIGTSIFNDCITREASARGLAIIDLRLICDRAEDFANSIEPSAIGGAKIASAIATFVAEHDADRLNAEFFVEPGGRT